MVNQHFRYLRFRLLLYVIRIGEFCITLIGDWTLVLDIDGNDSDSATTDNMLSNVHLNQHIAELLLVVA